MFGVNSSQFKIKKQVFCGVNNIYSNNRADYGPCVYLSKL